MKDKRNIWIIADHDCSSIDESAFGLISEARRIIEDAEGSGSVTAVIMGDADGEAVTSLRQGGADSVIHIKYDSTACCNGEMPARYFYNTALNRNIFCILTAYSEALSDFPARIAALMNSPLVTSAVDLDFDEQGQGVAVRPVSNGYLYEKIAIKSIMPVISFLPSALSDVREKRLKSDAALEVVIPDTDEDSSGLRVIKTVSAAPEALELEEADIIVAAGRGAVKNGDLKIINEFAKTLQGSVGGTRPVIDFQLLPYERQIGQTGRSVAPGLIINCGISGANEYTAGMEKSKKVVSINRDPRARIFRFTDLGVEGDLHEILPIVIEKIKEIINKQKGR